MANGRNPYGGYPIQPSTIYTAPNLAQLQINRLARQAATRKPEMPDIVPTIPQQKINRTQQMIAQAQQRRAMLDKMNQTQLQRHTRTPLQQQLQQGQQGGGLAGMLPDPSSPAGAGLSAAAATGLQLSGYSTVPRTLGQNIGEMMASYNKAYAGAEAAQRDRRMEEALFGLKVAEAAQPDYTTLQQNLMAAGYDLSSPEGQAAMRHQLEKSDADTIFLGGDKQKEMAYGSAIKTRENMAKQVNQDRELGTRLQTVVDLLESGVETGRVQSAMLPLKQLGREMGFLSDAQVADLTDQEIIDSAAAFLTPRMRVVGSGASSDRDMDFFARATVRLANTPEANLVIAKMQKQVMDYNRDRLSLFDQYVQREGNDFGFGDFADKEMGEIYSRVENNKQFSDLIKSGKIKEGDVFYNVITDEFDVLTKEMM